MNYKKILTMMVCCCLLGGLLSACGPSQEALNATATIEAENSAMTKTASVPTETNTPLPTSTVTPSPTPTPLPDAKAMLRWRELTLPKSVISYPPSNIGIEVGANAYYLYFGEELVKYPINGSFLLGDDANSQYLYGYSVLYSETRDREGFNFYTSNFQVFTDSAFSGYPNYQYQSLDDLKIIGDQSAGATVTYDYNGVKWRVDQAAFRVGKIAGFVFLRYPDGDDPLITIGDLGKVYANSILNPPTLCQIISVESVEGVSWPSYHFVAEGYYPGEGRMITLDGEVLLDGKLQRVSSMAVGGGGESADAEGRIDEVYTFGMILGKEVLPPSELTLTVTGYGSGCAASQVIPWPMP